MKKTFFVYQNKKYEFNLNRFRVHPKCISSKMQNENGEKFIYYNLIDDLNGFINISEESINQFLNYVDTQNINFSPNNVFQIKKLSDIYQIYDLAQKATQYIETNYKYLIDLYLNQSAENLNQEIENLISYHISEYITDHRLSSFPISTIYRILKKYSSNNEKKCQINDLSEKRLLCRKIIDFIFEIAKERGTEASILFTSIEIDEENVEYLMDNLRYDSDFVDLNMIKKVLLDQLFLMRKEVKNELFELKEEMRKMKRKYEEKLEEQNQRNNANTSMLFILSRMTNNRNLLDLLNFLSKENLRSKRKIDLFESVFDPNETTNFQKTTVQCIEESKDINHIGMNMKTLDMLASNYSIKSCEFITITKNFPEITFEIDQSSCNEERLRNIIDDIKYIKQELNHSNKKVNLLFSFSGQKSDTIWENKAIIDVICINETIVKIDYKTFERYSSVTSVIIPKSVEYIGFESFSGCSSLKEIVIPSTVTKIDEYAFLNCYKLTQITINPYQTIVSKHSFENCSSLTILKFGASVKTVKPYSFETIGKIEQIIIPSTVESISKSSFSGCTLLKAVFIGNSITKLEEKVFYKCESLCKIIIPTSVTSIGKKAFLGCISLQHLFIPSEVTHLGFNAFKKCSSLSLISIPKEIKTKKAGIRPKTKQLTNEGDYKSFDQYMTELIKILIERNQMKEKIEYLMACSNIGNDQSLLFIGYIKQYVDKTGITDKVNQVNSNDMSSYAHFTEKISYNESSESFKYYKMSADKGNCIAMNKLGKMFQTGEGVSVNKEEAANYFKQSANKGNSEAMLIYASMLRNGEGIPENRKEATKYYIMSIEKGNIEANDSYLSMLKCDQEIHVSKDIVKKFELLIKNENAVAMNKFAGFLSVFGSFTDELIFLSIDQLVSFNNLRLNSQELLFLFIRPSLLVHASKKKKAFSNKLLSSLRDNPYIHSTLAHLLYGYNIRHEQHTGEVSQFLYNIWSINKGIKSIVILPSFNNIDKITGYDFIRIDSSRSVGIDNKIKTQIEVIKMNKEPIVIYALISQNALTMDTILKCEINLELVKYWCTACRPKITRPIHALILISFERNIEGFMINQSIEWPILYLDTCYDDTIVTKNNNGLPLDLSQILFYPIRTLIVGKEKEECDNDENAEDPLIDIDKLIINARKSLIHCYSAEENYMIDQHLFNNTYEKNYFIKNPIIKLIRNKRERENQTVLELVTNKKNDLWSFRQIFLLSSPPSSIIEFLNTKLVRIIADIMRVIFQLLFSGFSNTGNFSFMNTAIFDYMMENPQFLNIFYLILNSDSNQVFLIDRRFVFNMNILGKFSFYKFIWEIATRTNKIKNYNEPSGLQNKMKKVLFNNRDYEDDISIIEDEFDMLMNAELDWKPDSLCFKFITAFLLTSENTVRVDPNYKQEFINWVSILIKLLILFQPEDSTKTIQSLLFQLTTPESNKLVSFIHDFTTIYMFFPDPNLYSDECLTNFVKRIFPKMVYKMLLKYFSEDIRYIYDYILINTVKCYMMIFISKNFSDTIKKREICLQKANDLFTNEFTTFASIHNSLSSNLDFNEIYINPHFPFLAVIQLFFIKYGELLDKDNEEKVFLNLSKEYGEYKEGSEAIKLFVNKFYHYLKFGENVVEKSRVVSLLTMPYTEMFYHFREGTINEDVDEDDIEEEEEEEGEEEEEEGEENDDELSDE